MMDLTLDIRDELTPALKALGLEAPKLLDSSLSGTARGYRGHALKYLQAMLHRRTGETQRQLRYYRRRDREHFFVVRAPSLANIYEHNGGATIVPIRRIRQGGGRTKNRAALRFEVGGKTVFTKRVHLAQRPFMSASYLTFDFSGTFEAQASAQIERAKARLGLK